MGLFSSADRVKCYHCDGKGFTITKGADSSDGNRWKDGCYACGGHGSVLIEGSLESGQFAKRESSYKAGSGWIDKK